MTPDLHEELDRLADTQPTFRPDPALWDRGRRARRRTRVFAGAAALAVVAIVGGTGAGQLRPDAVGPAGGEVSEGAIPSVIHTDVPEDYAFHPGLENSNVVTWADDVVAPDLSPGRASAAFVPGGHAPSLPVVITAADGAYHFLDLPGWLGADLLLGVNGAIGLALSPDGTRLAYAWRDRSASEEGPMPSGLAVLDLESGDLRVIPVEGGEGVRVSSIAWSPDSRWLAWSGRELEVWASSATGPGRPVTGRVAPGASRNEAVPLGWDDVTAVAATDGGDVILVRHGGRTSVWNGGLVASHRGSAADITGLPSEFRNDVYVVPGAVSPDGGTVALGSTEPVQQAWFVESATGRLLGRELVSDVAPDGAVVKPLGWVAPHHTLALVTPAAPDGQLDEAGTRLAVMTAPTRPADEWTYRSIGTIEGFAESARSMTVAVDLIPDLDGTSSQQLTREFPAPGWGSPWRERLPYVLGGLMALLAGLAYIRMLRHQA